MSNNEPLEERCWKCTKCGWVDCYSADELAEHGEPSECQEHYHESLTEIAVTEGLAALADDAASELRRAERAFEAAKAAAGQADRKLAMALIAQSNPGQINLRGFTQEVVAESYFGAHDVAVAMGYPSLTEALEHLDELRGTAT